MTHDEFKVGWKRMATMLEFTKKHEENLTDVMREFWRKYRLSSAPFWNKCVERAINDPGRRFFPSLGEMAVFADDIRDVMRQTGCDLCGWTGWREVEKNGVTGVKPCVCRQPEPTTSKRSGALKTIKEMIG